MEFLWENAGWIMLFLTTVFVIGFKKYTKNNYALTSKYREIKHYELPFPELLEATNNAMIKAGFKKVTVSPRTGAFIGETAFSMSSWMEFIEIRCEQTSKGAVLNFLSICGLPTQLYAWGKNKRNANRFFRELEKQFHISAK